MSQVEEALGRLDGVSHISAGYRSNTAFLSLAPGKTLDLEQVNGALSSTPFSCRNLRQSAAD
ncbi:MAG: hypothetical protein ACI97A_002481 [Planctomycetota bacterium]